MVKPSRTRGSEAGTLSYWYDKLRKSQAGYLCYPVAVIAVGLAIIRVSTLMPGVYAGRVAFAGFWLFIVGVILLGIAAILLVGLGIIGTAKKASRTRRSNP